MVDRLPPLPAAQEIHLRNQEMWKRFAVGRSAMADAIAAGDLPQPSFYIARSPRWTMRDIIAWETDAEVRARVKAAAQTRLAS